MIGVWWGVWKFVKFVNYVPNACCRPQRVLPGDAFARTGGTCSDGAVIAKGKSCTIKLTFHPTVSGAVSDGTVTIDSNDPDTKEVQVTLTGTGK